MAEIDADLDRAVPMQRLLQGDVGSGKTVVALHALLRAVEAGRQGALMAPTETLAEQHFLTIEELCAPLGVRVRLLTSSLRAKEHAAVRQLIASGDAQIVVGTHALIQREVDFADLAVAVVDEQHRFGVAQRSALVEGRSPHVLHLTATPIPRTLALTVYGDLEVSELALPPANRKPIITAWVTEERSSDAYTRLRRHLDDGRQAYVVCPLIEESETRIARAAEEEAERLRSAELRGYRVGCLHGRLAPAERRRIMAEFKAGELDVLVATTVIEVGVDVPNATIMIVQEADRFGLAQLHQLRGRVGRGAEQSYCLLVSRAREELSEAAVERLEAMVATTDGFELAERDLEIRGEGQLLGARQSGYSDLRFVRLRRDQNLLERARDAARDLDGRRSSRGGRRSPPRRGRASRRVLATQGSRRCGSPYRRTPGGRTSSGSPLADHRGMLVPAHAPAGDQAAALRIRRLGAGERSPVLDVFQGLSDRSRRLRFHGPKPVLREPDLEQLVDVGCCGREAVTAVEVATGRSIGVARFVRETGSAEAEIAFAVVDDWQGRGVGRALLAELVALARREGIERFHASIVVGNEAALALVRGVGDVVSSQLEDGAHHLVVALR